MIKRICYNCGKSFETEDKEATICESCKKLYENKSPKIFGNHNPVTMIQFALASFISLVIFTIFFLGLI